MPYQCNNLMLSLKIKEDYLFFASQDHHYHKIPLFWIAKEQ